MKTVILAGGLGTRLSEETDVRPKPMVEIGSYPILWHIMKHYESFGFREFCVALGYKGKLIKEFFLNYRMLATPELTVELGTGGISTRGHHPEDWKVHLVDTGLDTMTGGRLKRLRPYLEDGTFMMTYGDGLSDVDLRGLVDFHCSHGRLATVTAVRPPSRFGDLVLEGETVVDFAEKSPLPEGWINGGFLVLEPGVLDYIEGDETAFEREPLGSLAREGQLRAFRHSGFWQCMDTLRDVRLLERLWRSGKAPWVVPHRSAPVG
jgi:glucose-1-phosphate cytidylyltransferase